MSGVPRACGSRSLRLVTLTAMAVTLSSCASGPSSGRAVARRVLSADVARLDSAAHGGSRAAILAAAQSLRADLAAQHRLGRISSGREAAVLAQLERVIADTGADQAPPAPAVSPPAPPQDNPPQEGDGGGKGHD